MKEKPMGRKALLIGLILFFLMVAIPLEAAPSIPKPTGDFYVLDQANVLDSSTERTIVQTSAALAQKTKAQVVAVTVNSLEGYSPEEYALSLLREWGIGDKELNNGLLILVCPTERVSRIEVGYGLEGALPDGKTGWIQDEYMIPYFQQNDFDRGILNGYLAIVQEVAKEYQVAIDLDVPQAIPSTSYGDELIGEHVPPWLTVLGVVLIVFLLFIDHRYFDGFITGMLINILLRSGRGGGGGGGGFRGGGGSGGGGGSTRRW